MEQIIFGGSPNDELTVDFGGFLDWQRTDASPIVIKGPGKLTVRDFDATLFGGDALIEFQAPRATKLGNDRLELEIRNVNGIMAEDDSGIPDYFTRPRFLNCGFNGGFSKLTIENVRSEGLAGFKIQGGRVDVPRDGRLVHVNNLEIFDPNPDIYFEGRVLTREDVDFEKFPELAGENEIIRAYAAGEFLGDTKLGNQYSRHALNLRYFFGVIKEVEEVLVENVVANSLQRFAGDEVKQLERIYADFFNTMIAADPSTVVRDLEDIVRRSGVVLRNVVAIGHFTPEEVNSGCHFLTDQVKPRNILGSGTEVENGGYIKAAQGVLFERCVSIESMNASHQLAGRTSAELNPNPFPGFPLKDQGNYFTECRSVSGPNFVNLFDEEGNPRRSTFNSRAFGNWPPGIDPTAEISKCEAFYFNTRNFPGIANFVIDGNNISKGEIDPSGRVGEGAKESLSIRLDESEVPRVRKEALEWIAGYLPENLAKNLPFIDEVVTPPGKCEELEAEVLVLRDTNDALQADNETLKAERDKLEGIALELDRKNRLTVKTLRDLLSQIE